MLRLEPGEKVVASFRPSLHPSHSQAAHRCQEGDCGRVPFRVVLIRSDAGQRSVALCGLHYIEAGKQCPQLTWNAMEWAMDSSEGTLYLRLTASRAMRKAEDSLKTVPLFHQAEVIKCPLCNVRYGTNVEAETGLPTGEDVEAIDLSDAVHSLIRRVTAEHIYGHPSENISICYPAETDTARKRAMTEAM